MDLMQPVFDALGDAFEALGLGLRSIENEWGPGQVECTFAPRTALEAADNVLLFRTATRQICRRLGYFATFMCRPALKGFYSSGWHLHQSLIDASTGANLFMPQTARRNSFAARPIVSRGSVCSTRCPATVFATPTVNGYRRFRPNSLAPDRATWAYDHRGAMIRVLGGPDDPATRLENRIGEPAANPYLYILSQVVAGLAGIEAEPRCRRQATSLTRPNARCCRKACRKRSMRSTKSRCSAARSAIPSSTISSSSSEARPSDICGR